MDALGDTGKARSERHTQRAIQAADREPQNLRFVYLHIRYNGCAPEDSVFFLPHQPTIETRVRFDERGKHRLFRAGHRGYPGGIARDMRGD